MRITCVVTAYLQESVLIINYYRAPSTNSSYTLYVRNKLVNAIGDTREFYISEFIHVCKASSCILKPIKWIGDAFN